MLLEQMMGKYLRGCRARQLSSNTLETYTYNLSTFVEWWQSRRLDPGLNDKDLATLSTDDLEEYMEYLVENVPNCSMATKSIKMQALRTFVRWAQDKDYCSARLKVKTFKLQEAEIEPLSETELHNVYEACLMTRALDNIRDYALMRLLEETGMRVGECLGLGLTDVELKTNSIVLRRTKNKKNRIAYLTPGMKRDLLAYMEGRRRYMAEHQMSNNNLWIVVKHGTKGSRRGDPLKIRTIQDRMRRCGEMAGIEKRVSPHTLRHTFARNFITSGGNIYVLKELLGHSTLNMVLRYLKLWDTDKKDAYQSVMAAHEKIRRKEKLPKIKI